MAKRRKPKATRKARKAKRGGRVPLPILESRLERLNSVVKRRGGDYLE